MKHLSYETLPEIAPALCEKRSRPERILQFGEGNFLRGFVDYFVDVANEKTDYGSSVVVVTPRSGKKVDDFKRQDCLYTLCLNGIEQGKNVDEHRIICAISRCINGRDAFDDVLSYARSEDLRILISNTTEAGITTCDTDKYTAPGVSAFPAKLTRFLHERYTSLGQEAAPGLLILPCELIENNASQLLKCVKHYAALWDLGEPFVQWVEKNNRFCATLVDRIVPGYPENADEYHARHGYYDSLLVTAEPFAFWAIESDEELEELLPLQSAGLPIQVVPDISMFKKRKVSVLNGTHTSLACTALLGGLETVGQCMDDPCYSQFIQQLIFDEILPAVHIPQANLPLFASQVLDRFRNPYIRHELKSITLNTTSKCRARVLPTVKDYAEKFGKLPQLLCLGFAANIVYAMNSLSSLQDDDAVLDFYHAHAGMSAAVVVEELCKRTDFWGEDLTKIPGFVNHIVSNVEMIRSVGVRELLSCLLRKETET